MASDGVNDNFLKEWETARDVLKAFDDRLHDLRKYGFSFITAFLTASTILFESLSEPVKATVLGVTLLLIFGLFLMDRNYRVFQKAAATRAEILERVLNIELTEYITHRYKERNIGGFVTTVYLVFILGVQILGLAVLSNSLIVLAGAVVITCFSILFLSFDYPFLGYRYGKIDWMLDRLECEQGEEVRIIVTNIGKKRFAKKEFPKGTVMWKLVKEGETQDLRSEKVGEYFEIAPTYSFTWILKTNDLDPGIYLIYRKTLKKDRPMIPLRRKLRIKEKKKPSPSLP
ncbi:MAG: hypothetical protein ACETWE_07725 [Candidatus Bathyarchaeia archaeon]